MLSTAIIGPYISLSVTLSALLPPRPGSWRPARCLFAIPSCARRSPHPVLPTTPGTWTAYFPAAEAKSRCVQPPGEIPWRPSRLVLLICVSRLLHPPSGNPKTQPCYTSLRHSQGRPPLPPPASECAGVCIRERKQRSCPVFWRLLSSSPFVVRGRAKFADEVRINETQIKTGRTALMGSPQQGAITQTWPAPRPKSARLGLAIADPLHLLPRTLILFIETAQLSTHREPRLLLNVGFIGR